MLAAIINYAPTLLLRLSGSLSNTGAQLFLAAIALTKVVGVGVGGLLVFGRSQLGCALALLPA